MSISAAPRREGSRTSIIAAAVATGLAGTFDLVWASSLGLVHGRSFAKVWQSVASGWLGAEAYAAGAAAVWLGVATHFGIMAAMAATYAVLLRWSGFLRRRRLLGGALYGVALFGVMNGLVLPLRWPEVFPRWNGLWSVLELLAHIGVGLILAAVFRRVSSSR
ncbi:MAG: hypothetical protein ACK41C_17820 [Phenylobacterium sp.]|uniref:hypothetical protein n=1 Tax=Phenylobacterium sp. TaxID=1871053 RepID=UPI00391C85C1